MKNVIKVVAVIIGALIGAGFASGKEIYLFFGQFGEYGMIGMLIAGGITGILIYQTIVIMKENKIEKYQAFLTIVNHKHNILNKGMNIIVNGFLLISFYIMVAGFSAYMEQAFRMPIYLSSSIFIIVCYIVFQKSIQGVIKVNNFLVPLLILFIGYLGLKNMDYVTNLNLTQMEQEKQSGWFINGILYASYNSILLIPVLQSLTKYLKGKKEIKWVGLLSGILFSLLAFIIYGLLLRGIYYVKEIELPMIEIVAQFGKEFPYLYGLVIVVSIFTSAVSAGYSFLENIAKTKKDYQMYLIIICITSVFVAHMGFSTLVQILYPIFGILGCIQIYFILRYTYNFRKVERSIEKKAKN